MLLLTIKIIFRDKTGKDRFVPKYGIIYQYCLFFYLMESSSRSSLGVLPYASRKHLVKYAGFEKPVA